MRLRGGNDAYATRNGGEKYKSVVEFYKTFK